MSIKHSPLRRQGQRIIPPREVIVNFNSRKPKITFEFLSGDYSLSKCEIREKAEIIDSLYRISMHSWQELLVMGRKHGGCESLPLASLKCHVPDDFIFMGQKHATVFHNPGKIPILGIRVDDILFVFCIDRTFTAYNHGS